MQHKSLIEVLRNCSFVVILTIQSLYCTPTEMLSTSLLNKLKQINTTQQSNLWLKYLFPKLLSKTWLYIRRKDSTGSQFSIKKKTPLKPTETFQYLFYTTCYPLGAKCFAKGRALWLLRKNSSKKISQNTTGRERQRWNLKDVNYTDPPLTGKNKQSNLALCNTILSNSFKP